MTIEKIISGGRHVVRTRSWWKRGDVDTCAAQTNMQCWVHQDTILIGKQAENNLREAWEHESSKDEMNIVLRASNDIIGGEWKQVG